MELHWYFAAQDGPYPWNPKGARVTDARYLGQLAEAIEYNGFSGALIATLAGGTDPWTLASYLATRTEKMKFIVAQYAGVIAPLWLAQMAATVDAISRGRLVINMITGHDRGQPQLGIFHDHDQRYELADEYWGVFRRIMAGETVSFEGAHVRVRDARLLLPTIQKPHPELMFGGSSEAAIDFAARHADTWLSLALPPEVIAAKVKTVKERAAAQGRTIRCGLRLYVIVRETMKEAWEAAQWFYDHMDRDALERRRANLVHENRDSAGNALLNAFIHNNNEVPKDARAFEISPNLWGGFGLVRSGPGTAIVGDPETVIAMLKEYEAAGIEVFILGNNPHIEEAYRFGDLVMPLIKGERGEARVAWV